MTESVLANPHAQSFVQHWGEMGSRWGLNRSAAHIHAFLYLSNEPVAADVIAGALQIARSNVSTGLRELRDYGIVRPVRMAGDRRDHFVAETDLWAALLRVAAARRRREVDPTLAVLGEFSERLAVDRTAPPHLRERVQALHAFTADLARWHDQVSALPKPMLAALVRLGARVAKYIPAKKLAG